jgi:sigma-B regulation protein RsbU (phosphoserine phosphatase)
MKDFIRRLGRFYNFVILIFGVLLVRFVSVCFKPLRALTAAIVILLLYTAAAVAVFNIWGLWIDLFYPVFAFTLVYTASTLGRVLSEMRKRQLMETELKIASQIQNSFLPEKPPSQEGLSLSVFMKPAKQVGGDVYEFVQLPDERLGVMVGDVTGKGTPAALFMAKTVSQFKFIARDNPDPADVLTRLNNTVAAESRSALFVTLSYVIFDLKNKKLLMSNGGHLPLVTESGDGHMALLTTEEGLPIGVMEGTTFSKSEYPIKSGDCFVLYSDGISEARNLKEEEYGVKALQQQINDRRQGTADAILKQTIEHVTRFIGKAEQHDDMTLIVVKIN